MNKYLLTYKEVNKWFTDLLWSNLIGQNVTIMVQFYDRAHKHMGIVEF